MSELAIITNLFLRQSILDAWEDYQKSIHKVHYFTRWDYVILTASNKEQAEVYRMQIEERLKNGLLPSDTHYAVIPDPEGKRVGSGGATLNVLRYISEQSGDSNCFEGKKILVIHSGGDSKRVPQYSASGKLFSPVPRQLPDGRRSTLFDEFIVTMSGVPARIKDGMLVLSGDVLLLFNPLQIDFQFEGAAAISMKEKVEIGKNHGVFLSDENGNVGKFLHKLSVIELLNTGAVNEQGCVDLDTGAIIMDSKLLKELLELISTQGFVDPIKFNTYVNDIVRLSFYGDFLYPLASGSTLEDYKNTNPEGEFSAKLITCRETLWKALSPYSMKLICLSPAQFIHFGTTQELLKLVTEEIDNYKFLDWNKQILTNSVHKGSYACNNAFIDNTVICKTSSYIEDSLLQGSTIVGERCVISNMILRNVEIPDNVTMHGMKLKDGRYVVRIYGTKDNPKGKRKDHTSYLSSTLDQFIKNYHIDEAYLWDDYDDSLWNAKLFPICDTMEEAVDYALLLYHMSKGKKCDISLWLSRERMSLCTSFINADVKQILSWQKELDSKIRIALFINAIRNRRTIEDAVKVFGCQGVQEEIRQSLYEVAKDSDFSTKIRIYYYLSKLTSGSLSEELENQCFQAIKETLCSHVVEELHFASDYRLKKQEVMIELPARVNFGGGWSDTPPYCNEMGGTVLNAAIKLKGTLPIVIHVKRLDEPCIVLASEDSGHYRKFTSQQELQDCNNPFDPFALHKAALLACGFIPIKRQDGPDNLNQTIKKLGSGMYLSTQVLNIPRGSGLGTSSILAGACVKGLYEIIGQPLSEDELYARVIAMEQIMGTGGGWQDQVGGVTNGFKYIISKPGIKQEIYVEKLTLSDRTVAALQERFALIYTGQRRLARNLLREVVGRYVASNPNSIEVLYEIQKYATLMKFELEKGNIDGFAKLLREHWELSKRLDEGCTNTCIDHIFLSCEDLLEGRMICGAGGGGFLQVILKKGVTKDMLRSRIKDIYQDSGVDVWDCEFV